MPLKNTKKRAVGTLQKSTSLSRESTKIQKGSGNWRRQLLGIEAASLGRPLTPDEKNALLRQFRNVDPKVKAQIKRGNQDYFRVPKPSDGADVVDLIRSKFPTSSRRKYIDQVQAERKQSKKDSVRRASSTDFFVKPPTRQPSIPQAKFPSLTSALPEEISPRTRVASSGVVIHPPVPSTTSVDSHDIGPMYGPEPAYGPWQNPNLPSQRSLPKNHPLMQTIRQLENPRARTTASLPQQIKVLRFLQTQPQYARQASARLKYLQRQQMMRGAIVATNVLGLGGIANNYFNRPN
jgi:hypothetical protein